MIVPDSKDWTWVLERPCPECGFDASSCEAGAVSGLVRQNVRAWQNLHANGRIGPGRPNPEKWSSLEYACHVRDVYRRYHARIALMLSEGGPLFANWDQDASAIEERYDAQDPALVLEALAEAGEGVAELLDAVRPSEWGRAGRRSDGATFTVHGIARYMVHDPIHHVWDVTRPQN